MDHPGAETWRKVGVRSGHRLVLCHAPPQWQDGALPEGVTLARRRTGRPADVVVAFFSSHAALAREADALRDSITTDGALWVAWPRKAAGHRSDLSDEVVRATLLAGGLVDVKVARLDDDWSGLKFVWRLELRARRAGPTG